MHLAAMLKRAGGIPAYGNQRSEWDAGRAVRPPEPGVPLRRRCERRRRQAGVIGLWRSVKRRSLPAASA